MLPLIKTQARKEHHVMADNSVVAKAEEREEGEGGEEGEEREEGEGTQDTEGKH